jgi:hypothetical protein
MKQTKTYNSNKTQNTTHWEILPSAIAKGAPYLPDLPSTEFRGCQHL